MRICSVEGCEKKHKAKGLCRNHYLSKRYREEPEYRKKIIKVSENWRKKNLKLVSEWAKRWRKANREKYNAYCREYNSRLEVKERRRTTFYRWIWNFKVQYSHNLKWQDEEPERITKLYADTVCDITDKQKCDLQEKCLIEIDKFKKKRFGGNLSG